MNTACDLLIHNAVVVTANAHDHILDDSAIAIAGHTIAAVGASTDLLRRFTPAQTFDAGGAVAHPGFIDAHIHISQYTSRSVLARMAPTAITMGDWKAQLRPEDEHDSALLAAVDYLRAGYTGFVDPGTIFEPDAVAAVADEIGIRIWLTDPYIADRAHELGAHNPDLVSPAFMARWPKNTDAALQRLGRQLRRNDHRDGLVRAFIGLYGEGTSSEELHKAALALARQHGVQFHEHRGYNPTAYRAEERRLGRSIVAQLHDDGVLGPGTTFVHMNVVHQDDVGLLARSRTGIVWCPYSQLRMLGVDGAEPRSVELARAGAAVALATDIPRTVNFDALGTLATGAAAACGTPAQPHEILRMRTIAAAATIGAESELGSIELGKRADIVVRTPAASEALGLDPAWETAILGCGTPPALVLVNGRAVLRDGVPVTVDPAEIAERARRSVRGLMQRIGL
jgi:cytosine/adenosine deaminase-related metal-dependent hydrolase